MKPKQVIFIFILYFLCEYFYCDKVTFLELVKISNLLQPTWTTYFKANTVLTLELWSAYILEQNEKRLTYSMPILDLWENIGPYGLATVQLH